MFVGIVYVTICTGWLCKQFHGEESQIVTKHTFATIEECQAVTELAAKWTIGDELPWRVVCEKETK